MTHKEQLIAIRDGENPRRVIGVSIHAAILAAPEPMKIYEGGRW